MKFRRANYQAFTVSGSLYLPAMDGLTLGEHIRMGLARRLLRGQPLDGAGQGFRFVANVDLNPGKGVSFSARRLGTV